MTHDPFSSVRGLPLPALLPPVAPCALYCAVTPIDARGRLADASPVRVAGWVARQPVTISATPERVIVISADGPNAITQQGHIRIPAPIRRLCTIAARSRLLVTVIPDSGLIVAYPMWVVADILNSHPTQRGGNRE
jgi:hypothetical protein